jgi:hypothetical protein
MPLLHRAYKFVLSKLKKLRGLSLRANYIDRAPPLVGEVSANSFADRGCHVVSVTDPNCTHETEWIPFQIHYFSEYLVVPGS